MLYHGDITFRKNDSIEDAFDNKVKNETENRSEDFDFIQDIFQNNTTKLPKNESRIDENQNFKKTLPSDYSIVILEKKHKEKKEKEEFYLDFEKYETFLDDTSHKIPPQLENDTVFDIYFSKIEENTVDICQNLIPEGTPIDILFSKPKRFWYFDIIGQIGGDKEGYGRPSYMIPKMSTVKKKRKTKTYAEKYENPRKTFKQPNCGESHGYAYSTELVTGDHAINENLHADLQFMHWVATNDKSMRTNRRRDFIKKLSKKYRICHLLCQIFFGSFPQEPIDTIIL